MLDEYVVDIVPKNEFFFDELMIFIYNNSSGYRRSSIIDGIFDGIVGRNIVSDLDDVFGYTYNSDYFEIAPDLASSNRGLLKSHQLIQIKIDNGLVRSKIKLMNNYTPTDNMILRPVYGLLSDSPIITTFNIEFL